MLLCPDFDLDEICWIEAPYPEIKWKGTTQLNTAQVTVAMVRDPLAQLQSWRKAAEFATNIKLEECGNDLDRFTCPRSILLKHDVMAEYHGWRLCVWCMTVIKWFGVPKRIMTVLCNCKNLHKGFQRAFSVLVNFPRLRASSIAVCMVKVQGVRTKTNWPPITADLKRWC